MDHKTTRRPFGVTLLIGLVLIFASLNIVRTITAFQSWLFLNSLPLQVPVSYLIITGTAWSILSTIVVFSLLTRKKWSLPFAMLIFLGYPLLYWIDRLFFTEWATFANHWKFSLAITIFTVILALWIIKNPKTKNYLNKQRSNP